jgi:tRNA (adenine37-N6)-methyltransferase
MDETYQVFPVGVIRKRGRSVTLVISERFTDGLLGLEGFSHVILLCWFQASDTRVCRSTLRVHPRRDRENPLTGVFATRSPRRPNPIALYVSRIRRVNGNRVTIDPIDAFDGTPVIDIKPYIPESDSVPEGSVPAWVKRRKAYGAKGKARKPATQKEQENP